MRLQTWLATCSSFVCASTVDESAVIPQNQKIITSGSSSCYGTPASTSSSASSFSGETSSSMSASTLESNLSLQTLPSVPSLQKLPPETLTPLPDSHLCLISFTPRPGISISCIAIHGNEIYVASGHEINVYDRTTLTHLDAFNNGRDSSSGSVKAITFADGTIFTAHQDDKIRAWKMTAEKRHTLVNTLPTVNDKLFRLIFPKNYVNVRRHKKRLWIEHSDAVTGLAVNNGLIYSVSWDKSLKIWRTSDLRCVESIKAHEDAVNAVAVSLDGTIYTGSADSRVRIWSKPYGEKRHVLTATLEKHKSAVNALALNDDGSVLFSGACDRSILVWEREDSANHMAVIGALRGHEKAILCLINFSDLLFSGSADRTVRIWQRRQDGSYSCLSILEGHMKPVKSLTVVPDGEANGVVSLFSGSLDGEMKVWQISMPSNPPIWSL